MNAIFRFLCPALAPALAIALAASPALAKRPKEPRPTYEPVLPAPAPAPRAPDGAIFNAAAGYAPLVEGLRARAVGDTLTVVLIEQTSASKSAGSKTERDGGFSLTPPTAGPLGFLNPDALKASGESSFKGQGNATQTNSFTATLSVTIAEVRPNGTALVRGEKRMLLSEGNEWIQFSGIVRLADVSPENRIASSQVADARIVYSGKGSVQRAGREGWLSRFFNMITPF